MRAVPLLAWCTALLAAFPAGCSRGKLDPFPPLSTAGASAVAWEDFAGSDACAECHARQFSAWQSSTHGRAGGDPATPGLLVRAFDGRPIRFRDATVTPRVDRGRHVFAVEWEGRPEQILTIDGVVGGAHMAGGGTQGFVTRWADGTLRFLPFEMMRRDGEWFCNTGTRLEQGWLPIGPDLRLADCGDWPPVRVLGSIARFGACQECHGSQIQVAPEPGRPDATRFISLTINCESCHGPGRLHIDRMRAGEAGPDIGMEPLALRTRDGSLEICFRCHALKDALAPGFLPGMPLDLRYSLALPLLSDEPVFADGRTRTFAYQQGHLSSACYLRGSLTCVDCHDPHAQSYRDANLRPLPGRLDDGQCTACHPSKAAPIERHTQHAPGSAGSRCVACHMPYLQQPETGSRVPYARSDHTIPIPRPGFDAALGLESACRVCHRDMDDAALQRQVTEWWGEPRPHRPLVAGLERFRRRPDRDSALALLRLEPGVDPAAEFTALGIVLRDYLEPDMAELDPGTAGRFEIAARSADADIAAVGLAALHYARGDHRPTRRFLVARLAQLGDREAAVRSRWAVLLGFLADGHRERGQLDAAVVVYRKALDIRPGDSGTLMNLGLAHTARGDHAAAETAFLQSIAADSTNALAFVNLGMSRAARGDDSGAIMAYGDAIRVHPAQGLAFFNLGNLHLRAGRTAEAAAAYERAIAVQPGFAQAHFNLARTRITLQDLEGARTALRDGLAFDPANDAARAALDEIETTLRNRD